LFGDNRTNIGLILIIFTLMLLAGCQDQDQPTQIAENPAAVETPTEVPEQPGTPTDEPEASPTVTEAAPTTTPSPTVEPSLTPTETPTETPNPPTSTPTATLTPSPTPTPTPVPPPPPEWLSYLNRFRAMANLPPLSDREAYTLGSSLHSRYMVVNDAPIAHRQDKNNPLYDVAGDQAAKNGNIFATSQVEADHLWSVNFWVSAPFHLIGMLDPRLQEVGYGDHNEDIGNVNMAAVLDIRSDPRRTGPGTEYPIFFPGDGSETWVVRHSMFEWPDPYGSCPGYSRPSGPPIVLLLGDGGRTPEVTNHRFARGDQPLDSCLFDETSYRNPDQFAQKTGKTILDLNDAIVIIPREQLPINEEYTVQVTVDGQTYTWSFTTRKGPG
jgi:uncharacterized protein YkwD